MEAELIIAPTTSLNSTLELTRGKLAAWRQRNKAPRPIPDDIWRAAVQLSKPEPKEETNEPQESKPSKWVKWRTLILRCWAIDPEFCPKCGKEMKRSKALNEQHERQRHLLDAPGF